MPAEAAILQNLLGRLNQSNRFSPLVVRRKIANGMPYKLLTDIPRFRHFSLSLSGRRIMEYKPISAAAINSQSEKSSCNWKFKFYPRKIILDTIYVTSSHAPEGAGLPTSSI
jgi:hypothetical protein